MAERASSQRFQYDNQNYFQLASIQSVSLGYSVINIGDLLAQKYGAGTAILSIIIGNLLLWLIAIGIISSTERAKSNAIENFKSYVGKYGAICTAVILMFAFINWYALQINSSISALNNLYHLEKDVIIRAGAALGLLSALFSIGGIRLLKWITVCSLPILLSFHMYGILSSDVSIPIKNTWSLSFPAILFSVLALLPGVINFPTFFRHSRSKAHSYFALTILTILITFFEISTIWVKFSNFPAEHLLFNTFMAGFVIILSLTCANLLNIYLASAVWETVVPRFSATKGYAIIGLAGTLTYTFVQISSPVQFLEDLSNAYIACLGIILLMAFILKIIVKHRPRPFEKGINMTSWVFGCMISTLYEINYPLEGVDALLAGVKASVLFFVCVLFVEETVWATRKKMQSMVRNK
jgi:purine-cytosine permease-like protein